MENQHNLLKHINSIDGSHPVMFSTQHAPSGNFITPKHRDKNHDAPKNFKIDTRNQFQSPENEIQGQSNNKELNIALETTNNSRNDHTMTNLRTICCRKLYQ